MELPAISARDAIIGATGLVVGATAGATAGYIAGKSSSSRRRKGRKKKRKTTGRSRDRRFISRQKHERAYVKKHGSRGRKRYKSRKRSNSRRGIRYTKNGQPYKILASGKARFIKRRKR